MTPEAHPEKSSSKISTRGKKIFKIKGMHCNSCAMLIEEKLKNKVENISVSYSKEQAEIEFDENKISEKEIKEIIEKCGYEVGNECTLNKDYKKEKITECDIKEDNKKEIIKSEKGQSDKFGWIVVIGSVLLFVFVLYYLFGSSIHIPEFNFTSIDSNTSLFLLFFAGLLTGFHCIAMCGGFLVSYTTKNALNGHKSFSQHLVYGASKTISYTIIGAVFGLIGSIFFFTPRLRGGIAIFAGIFMIFYSLSMFGLAFFRRFQFNPKFLSKIATKRYSGAYFGPMMTGLLNGLFIACGPLQALYLYAAGTGSAVQGGISLAVFGLGTLPVMLGFGGIANAISHKATRRILKISAIIVLILGLIMLNRGLALTGTGYDINSIISGAKGVEGISQNVVIDSEGYQVIRMDVTRYGWEPDKFVLKKNIPVKWIINGKEINGCNNAIQVPKLKLNFNIKQGEQTITFIPTEDGVIPWSCWMGMIRGTFIVTDSGEANQEQLKSANQITSSGGSCGGGGSGGCGCGG